MPEKQSSPDPKTGARSATPLAATDSTKPADTFDFDQHIVERVDASIWRALYDEHFRLAVKCEGCGRWLTSGLSKRDRLGPHCKTKKKTVESDG